MKKLKIYLESTVFNRYFEPERDCYDDILILFKEIEKGNFEAYTSAYVINELMDAIEPKRNDMLELIKQSKIISIDESDEAEALAEAYVVHNVITRPHYLDRLHLACATVNSLDAIISFNFSHINRKKTKELSEYVNKLNGFEKIYIGTPMEVIEYEE